MKRRQNKNRRPPGARERIQSGTTKPNLTGRTKLWAFRLTASLAVPAILFLLVEASLRLFGFGYPCRFLLKVPRQGATMLEQNNQFGWRFFGPSMARLPAPLSIPEPKPASTTRIFVFGESAAYGDPQPDFGLPRMLQTILSLRHPGMHFEV